MNRSATAVWQGGLKDGKGSLTTQSKALREAPYGFGARFGAAEGAPSPAGTNPEELIAAAHAGCFTMQLSALLGREGLTPERLATSARVTLEQVEGAWTITAVHLETQARVPDASPEVFERIAEDAKRTCPVSRLLQAEISLDARLEAGAQA